MRRFVTLVVLLAFTACGGSDSPSAPTPASVAGTWNLQSINGSALPFVIAQTGANRAEILSEALTVVSTGSFTQITTIRTTVNGVVATESAADAGSYVLNGTAATFTFNSNGSVGTGQVTGSTLTVATTGVVYVFKKQ
jgi:hypothetical protein